MKQGAIKLPSTWVSGIFFLATLTILGPGPALSQSQPASKEKAAKDEEYVKLRVEVTAGEKDAPVGSASVYVRYEQERTFAKDKKIEMNLKTNRDGVAVSPGLPRGKVLVQVVAPGWKTYGQWYELDKQEHTLKIKLQKPPKWY